MKKTCDDVLRREYRREDLGTGVRAEYLRAYRKGVKFTRSSEASAQTASAQHKTSGKKP